MRTLNRTSLTQDELDYWKLPRDPFEDEPDAEGIWMGRAQIDAERRLRSAAERAQVVALVGDVGSGKSTLLRRLVSLWNRSGNVLVCAPSSTDKKRIDELAITTAILRGAAPGQRIPSAREARAERVRTLLEECATKGVRPVLIIEEAHDLPPSAFVDLKRVWDSGSLLRRLGIILVGLGSDPGGPTRARKKEGLRPLIDGDLGSRLTMDGQIAELGQRTLIVSLKPLGVEEIASYLTYRLQLAGVKVGALFHPSAVAALADPPLYAYPLAIANRAALALRYACQVGDELVTSAHVERATSL